MTRGLLQLIRTGALLGTLTAGVAACGGGSGGGEPGASVEIVEPVSGVTASSPVRVALQAHGIEIAPAAELRAGTAHHHLFLDRDVTPMSDTIPAGLTGIIHLGRGQTEFVFDSLTPGSHRVIAVLADPGHVPIPGAATDTIMFTVP